MTPPRPTPATTRLLSRGDLRLLVLALLGDQPRHGYELIQHVSELFVRAYTPSAGTMYPLLASFEQAGWVLAEDDAGRRRFRITESGRAELLARRDEVKAAQHRACRAPSLFRNPLCLPMKTSACAWMSASAN
jgi:DNA-binding PadR family transcriptional regulator